MSLRAALAADERAVASDEWRGARKRRRVAHSRLVGVNGGVGVLDGRQEFAGGEGVEAAETGVEFGGGQAAIAIERAEKVGGGLFSFLGIAFEESRREAGATKSAE